MVAAAAALVIGTGLAAAPAGADPGYLPGPLSGATVTHLNVAAGHGYVNLTLTAGPGDQIVGLTVSIPADGGTWVPLARRSFAGPGLTCTGGTGTATDPLYTCLTAYDPQQEQPYALVPDGRYQLSLPVTRQSGPAHGMTGSVALIRAGLYADGPSSSPADSFPVLDPSTDDQSSAELRELFLNPTGLGTLATGLLSVSVQVVPGEHVTGVYVSLSLLAGTYSSVTVNDRAFGNVVCGPDYDYPSDPGFYVISCHDSLLRNGTWASGRYQLTLRVATIGQGVGQVGTVALRHLGAAPVEVDDFQTYYGLRI